MSVSCKDASFTALQGIAATYIVVYGFGGLAAMFFAVKRHRETFPFLTKAFVDECYFWDILVTMRKMLFVILSLFAAGSLQLFFGSWLLFATPVLQSHFKPYKSMDLARADTISAWVLLVTVTTGFLFLNGTLQAETDATNDGGIAVASMLLILNLGVVLWLFAGAAARVIGPRRRANQKRQMEALLESET
eukprot:TRINITY_DN2999_c0_g1_i1.p2 TRINITY_DN2999_c0_g1~~TRINITY_DN2999_c0_g1_i1.p2  ORF type:complete len:219 (+),score=43.99 TRINITY_DN2999_c0_g1_i1:87-659(+)